MQVQDTPIAVYLPADRNYLRFSPGISWDNIHFLFCIFIVFLQVNTIKQMANFCDKALKKMRFLIHMRINGRAELAAQVWWLGYFTNAVLEYNLLVYCIYAQNNFEILNPHNDL